MPLPASPTDSAVSLAQDDDVDEEYVAFLSATCNSLTAADVDAACASCPALTKLCTQISNGWPPSPKGLDVELLSYYQL